MLLAGKVAVITGAGRGIGRAIARRFASEGAKVVVAARTVSEIEAVAAEIRGEGGTASAVPANVADEQQCGHLVRTAEAQYARIDILVNNAGEYGPVKPVEEILPADWDRVIAVHLRGAYLLTRAVLPGMYARRSGVILNISSLSAKAAFPWGAAYAAAKAGLLGLTRVAAAESARQGIRANALCPGPVTETRMSKELGQTLAARLGVAPEQQLREFLSTILQGRGQTVQEVAAAALFLCSDQSSAITGQALNVDGGAAFY
jgi:NAD(P)-dependent dehydrogenase (short-subunit alcohol dehydrogenase family)